MFRDKAKYFALVALVALIDQLSKVWARQELRVLVPGVPGDPIRYQATDPIPIWWSAEQVWFELRYTTNPGAAWGIFSQHTGTLALLSGVMILVIGWVLLNARKEERLLSVALSLMLGGAFGNLLDRIIHKEVTDFFHAYLPLGGLYTWVGDTFNWAAVQQMAIQRMPGGIYDFPIFNVADSCVVVGTILLLLALMRGNPEPIPEPAATGGTTGGDMAMPESGQGSRGQSSSVQPITESMPGTDPQLRDRPTALGFEEPTSESNGHADLMVLVDPHDDRSSL